MCIKFLFDKLGTEMVLLVRLGTLLLTCKMIGEKGKAERLTLISRSQGKLLPPKSSNAD